MSSLGSPVRKGGEDVTGQRDGAGCCPGVGDYLSLPLDRSLLT